MTKEQNEREVKKVLMEIKIKKIVLPLIAIAVIILMAILIWHIISHPAIMVSVFLILLGIGIIAGLIRAVVEICTFWFPGSDFWKL